MIRLAVLLLGAVLVAAKSDMFYLNDDNLEDVVKEFLEKPKDTKPLFVNMVVNECTAGSCAKFAGDSNRVATITKG